MTETTFDQSADSFGSPASTEPTTTTVKPARKRTPASSRRARKTVDRKTVTTVLDKLDSVADIDSDTRSTLAAVLGVDNTERDLVVALLTGTRSALLDQVDELAAVDDDERSVAVYALGEKQMKDLWKSLAALDPSFESSFPSKTIAAAVRIAKAVGDPALTDTLKSVRSVLAA